MKSSPDLLIIVLLLWHGRHLTPEMHNLNPLNFKIFFEQFSINVIKRRQEDIRRRKRGPLTPPFKKPFYIDLVSVHWHLRCPSTN